MRKKPEKTFWDDLELKKCFQIAIQAAKEAPVWLWLVPVIGLIFFVILLTWTGYGH